MTARATVDTLRDYLAKGVTGCLGVARGSQVGHKVFLMQGEILAAHGPNDGLWIIRRLVNNGALSQNQGAQLEAAVAEGHRFEEILIGQVPDELFLDLLAARFRQALLDFMRVDAKLRFESMDAIFVDNIQVGHDTDALIAELQEVDHEVAELRAVAHQVMVSPGPAMPSRLEEARLQDLCDPPLKLSQLLDLSPFEPAQTLGIVKAMLGTGGLAGDRVPGQTLTPAEEEGSAAPAPAEDLDIQEHTEAPYDLQPKDEATFEEPTAEVEDFDSPDDLLSAETVRHDLSATSLDSSLIEELDELDELIDAEPETWPGEEDDVTEAGPLEPVDEDPSTLTLDDMDLEPLEDDATEADPDEETLDDTLSDTADDPDDGAFQEDPFKDESFEEDPFQDDALEDDAFEEEPSLTSRQMQAAIERARQIESRREAARLAAETSEDGIATHPPGPVRPSEPGSDGPPEDDEDSLPPTALDVFLEREDARGSGKGIFTLEKELLDFVDLSPQGIQETMSQVADEYGDNEIVELGDAESLSEEERAGIVSLNLDGPRLRDSDIRAKLSVAGEVLAAMSQAYDAHRGRGAGLATIQLLVEGAPAKFSVLYAGVEVDRKGNLDADQLIANLKRRPKAEHRRLLNQGVLDLINRALATSVEELPDEAIDALLQQIAGYQQRLGR